MARLHIVIPDDLDRELDLLCVNKSELARRGLLMALAEVKKNFGVALAAANDPAPGTIPPVKNAVAQADPPPTPTPTVTPEPAPPATPSLDDLIGRGSLVLDGQMMTVFPFEEVCTYLDVDEDEAANDMMAPPSHADNRLWITADQLREICTLSPHPAKADSLKQWA